MIVRPNLGVGTNAPLTPSDERVLVRPGPTDYESVGRALNFCPDFCPSELTSANRRRAQRIQNGLANGAALILRPSKPVRRGRPTLGRFDSGAAP